MLPLFFPRGVAGNETPDPARAAREFQAANKVLQVLSQWNWKEGAFPDMSIYKEGDMLRRRYMKESVDLGTTESNGVILPDDGLADPLIWKIPYNRGWECIADDPTMTPMRLEWTTEYPELVLMWGWCQYVRWSTSSASWPAAWAGAQRPRVRIGMRVDGGVLPGLGPNGGNLNGSARGDGYAVRTLCTSLLAFQVLPPGTHMVEGVAMQKRWADAQDESTASTGEDQPESQTAGGVCIGTRKLLVLGFPMGAHLGA